MTGDNGQTLNFIEGFEHFTASKSERATLCRLEVYQFLRVSSGRIELALLMLASAIAAFRAKNKFIGSIVSKSVK